MSTNTSRPASDQDYFLLLPVIPVTLPVIQDAPGVPAVQPSDETEVEEELDAGEGPVVEYGEVLTLLGEFSKE